MTVFDHLHLDKLFIPVILQDCATGVLIATSTIKGEPQSIYSPSYPPLHSQFPSMSAGTVLTHHDGDVNVSFSTLNTKSDYFFYRRNEIHVTRQVKRSL